MSPDITSFFKTKLKQETCLLAYLVTYLPITYSLAYLLYLQTNQTNAKAVNELQTIFLKPKDAELKNTVQTKAGVDGTLTNGMMVTKSNELDAIFGLSVGALDAEIRWALNVAMMHASYRSWMNWKHLLQRVFPDSNIVQKFQMSKTKVLYMIIFGLSDYFHKKVLYLLTKSLLYSLSFDESLNEVLNKEQMNMQIWVFNDLEGRVVNPYLDSKFLYWPNVSILAEEILNATKKIQTFIILVHEILCTQKRFRCTSVHARKIPDVHVTINNMVRQ